MILIENINRESRPCIDYKKLNQVIQNEFFFSYLEQFFGIEGFLKLCMQ